jgi:hypothetical protein
LWELPCWDAWKILKLGNRWNEVAGRQGKGGTSAGMWQVRREHGALSVAAWGFQGVWAPRGLPQIYSLGFQICGETRHGRFTVWTPNQLQCFPSLSVEASSCFLTWRLVRCDQEFRIKQRSPEKRAIDRNSKSLVLFVITNIMDPTSVNVFGP